MACRGCIKRGKLIGIAAKRVVQGKPISPVVRGIGRSVRNDVSRVLRPMAPRFVKR